MPLQGNLAPDHCGLSFKNAYSNETSIKFSQDCGGKNTYNVFKTGIIILICCSGFKFYLYIKYFYLKSTSLFIILYHFIFTNIRFLQAIWSRKF